MFPILIFILLVHGSAAVIYLNVLFFAIISLLTLEKCLNKLARSAGFVALTSLVLRELVIGSAEIYLEALNKVFHLLSLGTHKSHWRPVLEMKLSFG